MGNEKFSQEFRVRLRATREGIGLSQSAVGRLIGKRQNTVNEYESGKAKPPLIVLAQLAELYHVTTDYLLGRTEEPHLPMKGGEEVADDSTPGEIVRVEALLLTIVDLLQAQGSLSIPEDWDQRYRHQVQVAAQRLGIATDQVPTISQTTVRRTPR